MKCATSSSSELRMVLLGKNGAEKSVAGNMILGRRAFKETSTRVSEVQRGRVEDRNISVIDTPGFFNTELTDEDLQNEMMKSLSLSHPGPHVFLLVIRPDTFTDCDGGKIVKKIEENFGAQVLKFTLLLFIREQMSNKEWMVLTLSKTCQDLISHFRGKYHVINSESDATQITTLLEKINNIVKQNDNQHYNNDNNGKFTAIKKLEQKVVQVAETEQRPSSTSQIITPMPRKYGGKTFGVIHQPQRRRQDLRIVMLGKCGAGKSATGNTILGNDLFKEEMSPESVTKQCETHQKMVEGRTISVIDTPGLLDTIMTEEELQSELENCVLMSTPGPHVLLLVIRLDVRFTQEEKDTVRWIQENFGEDAMNYAMVLFTRGDQLDRPIEDFLKKTQQLKCLVDKCKAGYHVFNNKDKNQTQVTELIEKIDRLVEENGGANYTNELYQEVSTKIVEEQERKRQEEKKQTMTEKEQRTREEELMNKWEELRIREEELSNREKEQKKREEQEQLRKIFEGMKRKELVRKMSFSGGATDRVVVLASIPTALIARGAVGGAGGKYPIMQKKKTGN